MAKIKAGDLTNSQRGKEVRLRQGFTSYRGHLANVERRGKDSVSLSIRMTPTDDIHRVTLGRDDKVDLR
jgi:hypothetical protein